MNDAGRDSGMKYALGFVLKLAEHGVTLDDIRQFAFAKEAAVRDPFKDDSARNAISKRTYDRIYSRTRGKLRREADKSQMGGWLPVWQGFRDPLTGSFRFPLSFGSTRRNTEAASMTPAQANFVSILTKHRGMKDFRDVHDAIRGGSGDFEFMGDPTMFNARTGKFTNAGRKSFAKAYRHVYGYDPTEFEANELESRLFGANAGFDGNPHQFERFAGRKI